MLGAARGTWTRGPDPGRRDRAESLANPTRPQEEWVMNHFQLESRIDAPVEHVWAFLCDSSRWHDWDPRTEYSDWSGPVDQVGTTVVATSRMMGFEMKGTLKVLEVEPLQLIRIRSDMGPEWVYRFEPEGEATRLTFEADYEMPGHLPGFIKNLMTKSWVERYVRQQLEDFKALAEATVPAPA
jgi:ligand-binding SRPBCC domain-containing protein